MFSVLVLLVVYGLSKPCFAVEFNITRSLQDTFSVSNCSLCAKFSQATCFQEGVCRCPTASSTFFIYKQRCNSPSSFINDQNCLSWPRGKNFLKVIDLTSASSSTFSGTTFSSCSVTLERTFKYLGRRGNWMTHRLQSNSRPVFAVVKVISRRRMVLKIRGSNGLASFAGRIVRVDLQCKGSEGETNSCLILKAKGTISTTGGVSPTQASVPTIQYDLTTQSSPSKSQRNKPKVPATPRIHYIGSQSKPRHTSTAPSNITVITPERINGAVSIDKTNRKGDPVVVAIISVLGAIACVLVIAALFAWFVIKYYRRFRPHHQRSTLQSTVIRNNQDVQQNAIQMTTVTAASRPEPVYSELPDVLESANRNRSCGSDEPTDISIPVENQDDFFIIRNPLQYNTLPRARKLTDPLPATPCDKSKTPDLRLTHRTTSSVGPHATRTAQFLSEVEKNFNIPVFQDLTRRKRSCTDVADDGVFFENIPSKGLRVDLSDAGKEKPKGQSTQSIYEDLSETRKQGKISIYQPLVKATLQPPDVRKTTLERITNQEGTLDAHLECTEQDPVPEYHILEQLSPEQEAMEIAPTNIEENSDRDNEDGQGALCIDANTKGSFSPPIREHHSEKGPNVDKEQGCTNQGLECDVESTVDTKSAAPGRKHSQGALFNGAITKGPCTRFMNKHHAEEELDKEKGQGCSRQRHEHDDVSNLDKQCAQASGQMFKKDHLIGLTKLHESRSHSRGRIREKIFLRPRPKSWEL